MGRANGLLAGEHGRRESAGDQWRNYEARRREEHDEHGRGGIRGRVARSRYQSWRHADHAENANSGRWLLCVLPRSGRKPLRRDAGGYEREVTRFWGSRTEKENGNENG